jgi:cysteine-rich repeat protein
MRRARLLQVTLFVLLVASTHPALATVADDVCTGDPCVIAGSHAIDPLSVLDFGARSVVLDGTLDVGTGQMTILTGSFTQNGQIRAQGGSGAGGIVIIQATNDLTVNATAGDSFRMNGLDGGILELTSLLGNVMVSGAVDLSGGFTGFGGQLDVSAAGDVSVANADLGATDGGTFLVDANGTVALGSIDVSGGVPDGTGGQATVTGGEIEVQGTLFGRGGLNGFGAFVTLDAIRLVRVTGAIDVLTPSGDGGEVEILSNTATVTGSITADGGIAGGQVLITTSARTEIHGTVTADATSGSADAGGILVDTTGALVLSGSLSASAGSQGFGSTVDLAGCTVDAQATSGIDSVGTGATLSVAAGAEMTLRGAYTAESQITLRYAQALVPPDVVGASFSPAPTQILDPLVQCLPATCGNGTTEPGEQCDDSGESAFCNGGCTFAACGDLIVNGAAGETCDEGGQTATCDDDCTAVECGDGVVNEAAGEGCDDGALDPGDGCDASCQVEGGFACSGEPSVCGLLGAGCPVAPSPLCSENGKNILLMIDKEAPDDAHPTTGNRARLVFRWVRGSNRDGGAVVQEDFGTPGESAPGGDLRLCFYEDGLVQYSLTAPQSGPWLELRGKGWRYLDKGASSSSEGVERVILKGNDAGKAAIVILASGSEVPVPALPRNPAGHLRGTPLDRAYHVQVHIDGQPACHGMSYEAGSVPDVHVDKRRSDGSPVGVWKIKRAGP